MIVHFFAAARAAAAISSFTLPDEVLKRADTLQDLIDYLGQQITGSTPAGMSFAQVLAQCSFLLDGVASPATASVAGATRLDVLPPFAGG